MTHRITPGCHGVKQAVGVASRPGAAVLQSKGNPKPRGQGCRGRSHSRGGFEFQRKEARGQRRNWTAGKGSQCARQIEHKLRSGKDRLARSLTARRSLAATPCQGRAAAGMPATDSACIFPRAWNDADAGVIHRRDASRRGEPTEAVGRSGQRPIRQGDWRALSPLPGHLAGDMEQ